MEAMLEVETLTTNMEKQRAHYERQVGWTCVRGEGGGGREREKEREREECCRRQEADGGHAGGGDPHHQHGERESTL